MGLQGKETIIMTSYKIYKQKVYLIRKVRKVFMWMLLKIPLEQLVVKLHRPKEENGFRKILEKHKEWASWD